jgi:hypothetical protein
MADDQDLEKQREEARKLDERAAKTGQHPDDIRDMERIMNTPSDHSRGR